jgi:hypothetical protein
MAVEFEWRPRIPTTILIAWFWDGRQLTYRGCLFIVYVPVCVSVCSSAGVLLSLSLCLRVPLCHKIVLSTCCVCVCAAGMLLVCPSCVRVYAGVLCLCVRLFLCVACVFLRVPVICAWCVCKLWLCVCVCACLPCQCLCVCMRAFSCLALVTDWVVGRLGGSYISWLDTSEPGHRVWKTTYCTAVSVSLIFSFKLFFSFLCSESCNSFHQDVVFYD